jgi:O-antigen ligase
MLVAGLIVRYDGYEIVDSAINLKATLIDNAIILGLIFYGTRNIKDAVFLTKAIVAAVTVANIIWIASIRGYIDIGTMSAPAGAAGRVEGPFGHPNETAAVIVALLPACVVIARSSRGFSPAFWLVGAMSAIAMLFMTVSRGAFLAMLIGYPWAAYVFRRYLSLREILLWTCGLIVLGGVILSLLGTHFVALLLERVVTESGSSDVGALSSGRSGFWVRALETMLATPLTLITGFGWNVYDSMAFVYAPHNQYLLTWFELGLVGLCSFVLLLVRTLSTVRSGVDRASPPSRGYLMAFVFGFGAFLIVLFFSNLSHAWTYVWAYAGVSLRMALITLETKTSAPGSVVRREETPTNVRIRGVFGGSSKAGRRLTTSGQATKPLTTTNSASSRIKELGKESRTRCLEGDTHWDSMR